MSTALDTLLRSIVEETVRDTLRKERPPSEPERYLPVAEAARLASVTPATIRTWIDAKYLGRYRAGRELRVKASELDAYLARTDVGQSPDPEDVLRDRLESGRRMR